MTNTMRALVVMGVAGCGKSSVATALCERLGAHLIEGDAFHPERNVRKMASGTPLTDADRQDWLATLAHELVRAAATHRHTVLTCSALKRRYRELLRAAEPGLGFVFLALPPEEAARRVAQRSHHFMPATLVESQFRDLEPPTGEPRVLAVDATAPIASLVDRIVDWWP
jgi:gluconokinase